ncbi:hypothetical protein EDD40_7108 [Saccharothrix texasensis]|uniref:Uncharacterized protein n=1 Tax=Saccharothrix texasensis TaxID=103734 RepID=A0A3N1HH79_9PSEU|nr:hypothetical protein EDD40_7108 [Saccharothrix texasensis]
MLRRARPGPAPSAVTAGTGRPPEPRWSYPETCPARFQPVYGNHEDAPATVREGHWILFTRDRRGLFPTPPTPGPRAPPRPFSEQWPTAAGATGRVDVRPLGTEIVPEPRARVRPARAHRGPRVRRRAGRGGAARGTSGGEHSQARQGSPGRRRHHTGQSGTGARRGPPRRRTARERAPDAPSGVDAAPRAPGGAKAAGRREAARMGRYQPIRAGGGRSVRGGRAGRPRVPLERAGGPADESEHGIGTELGRRGIARRRDLTGHGHRHPPDLGPRSTS